MAVNISASVGQGGVNRYADVLAIQQALNKIPPNQGGPDPKLVEDGLIGPKTRGAILKFQRANAGLPQDSRIDVNGPTLARLNTLLGGGGGPNPPNPQPAAPKFSDQNLYGPNGPARTDIRQDALGDCYFVATLGALAHDQPQVIRNAIHYDAATQRFRVTLYKNGTARYIWVTQAELEDNVTRQGGSRVDNTGCYERVWPAVIETAFAKMHDTNAADGLGEGYRKLNEGGFAADAMLAILGNSGTKLTYQYYYTLGTSGSVFLLGTRVWTALQQRKAVTLSTDPETDSRTLFQRLTNAPIPQDGLVDNHVYMVISMTQNGLDWNVRLRNPWGTNNNVGEGRDTASATLTVSLRTLVDTRGLESFDFTN
jgi:peptidoglycan hydrolase-like protein with peptidoglycan-binding domain